MSEKLRINAIAAIGKNREIGKGDNLLWKLDADFAHMKELVKGHPLIMGRKTYESIGLELPYSPSIVVTRETDYVSPYPKAKQTYVVNSFAEAISTAGDLVKTNEQKEVFVFGGQQVYEAMLPQTDRLYLTSIEGSDPEADSFFPDYEEFKNVLSETKLEEHGTNFTFLTLER